MKEKIPDPNKMKRVKGPRLSAEQVHTAKIRVTTFLDEDVLQALKETAQGSGTRYQTLLNQLLRQALIGDTKTILERLEKLEKAVFKSRAA
ncbi:MAG: BrnA antitoxin family protein [Pseudomonadota bacterium]